MDRALKTRPFAETDLHIQQMARSLKISYQEAEELAKKTEAIEEIGCVEIDEHGIVIPRRPILISKVKDATPTPQR